MTRYLAYAVVREDPPIVLVASDLDVLHWVIAIKVIARTPSDSLTVEQAASLRQALVEERWADAVVQWIDITGVAVDVHSDLPLWTEAEVTAETAALEFQFTPLFRD